MEGQENIPLNTWGNLWKLIGIENHARLGYYYMLGKSKLEDLYENIRYYLGLEQFKPPLFNESPNDFYVRKIYTSTYECFSRPLLGPAEHHIKIGLRKEIRCEAGRKLILVDGKEVDCINFGSYNYLGFGGRHPIVTEKIIDTLKKSQAAVTGFACETGITEEQEELQNYIANFLHKEASVVVPMGFATNSTLIPILVGEGDVVFSDALNHSSIITGIRSSNAEVRVFKHNDMVDLKKKLEDLKQNGMKNGQQPKKVLIIVEGLYSMEGEYCPLKELIELKKIYGFYLYVDEAHSIGALGKTGRGITEHLGCNFDDVDILMGTFSKSFGAAGGYIASDKKTIELLRSNCYSYVYGSAMSPVECQQILSCFKLMETEEGEKRFAQLRKSSINLRRRLKEAGCHVLGDTDSPVIPVMFYHTGKIKDICRLCLNRGIAVVGVGYPACSEVSCRVRFCISAAHTDEDMDKAFEAFIISMKEIGCIYGDVPMPNVIYHAPKIDMNELQQMKKEPRQMTPLYENSDKRKVLPVPEKMVGKDILSYDIHGFNKDMERQNQLINTIRNFGCGSCGPRAFYGTTVEHLQLEDKLMKFFGTTNALVYSYGNNTLTSVIPVYGLTGDYLLVDEKCNYPIQLGCRLSKKAHTIKFKHNDVEDLKAKLAEAKAKGTSKTKYFIITEGVFQHDLSIAPLNEICKLRSSNTMLIVDDSYGFGVTGNTLKGTYEHLGLTIEDIDIYCGSLEFVGCSVGGFVVGHFDVIDRQRLLGAGFIFSASAPPFTCRSGQYVLDKISEKGVDMGIEIRERRQKFNQLCEEKQVEKKIEIIGNEILPIVYLNVKNGDNQSLVDYLRTKGYYTNVQLHLDEDWCQEKYVKVVLNDQFTVEMMREFVNVLAAF